MGTSKCEINRGVFSDWVCVEHGVSFHGARCPVAERDEAKQAWSTCAAVADQLRDALSAAWSREGHRERERDAALAEVARLRGERDEERARYEQGRAATAEHRDQLLRDRDRLRGVLAAADAAFARYGAVPDDDTQGIEEAREAWVCALVNVVSELRAALAGGSDGA